MIFQSGKSVKTHCKNLFFKLHFLIFTFEKAALFHDPLQKPPQISLSPDENMYGTFSRQDVVSGTTMNTESNGEVGQNGVT